MVAVYMYRSCEGRPTAEDDVVQLTRDTSERLTAGMARLVRTVKHLGHRVAAELNGRPRQTLAGRTPAEALNDLLLPPHPTGVATTT